MSLDKTLDPNGILVAVNGNHYRHPQVMEDIVDTVEASLDVTGTPTVTTLTASTGITTAALTATGVVHMPVVADSNVVGGIPVCHLFEIADAATANYDITLTTKTEIQEVIVIKTGAAGVAVTCTVKNDTSAITDVMDLAVPDKTVVRAATIDDATSVISAGHILRVAIAKTTSGAGCKVIVRGVTRA